MSSLTMSGNFPILHTAIAGALGAAACAYLEPEIIKFGTLLGGAMASAAKAAKSKAKDMWNGMKRANVCVAEKELQEQQKAGDVTPDSKNARIAHCPKGKIREVKLVKQDYPDPDFDDDKRADILAFFKDKCVGQQSCEVPACTKDGCEVKGCEFDSPEKYRKRSIKYKCEDENMKAKICLGAEDEEKAKADGRIKEVNSKNHIIITRCGSSETLPESDRSPDMGDTPESDPTFVKLLEQLGEWCDDKSCAIPLCAGVDDCPTKDFGCQFTPENDTPGSEGTVSGDKVLKYKCKSDDP